MKTKLFAIVALSIAISANAQKPFKEIGKDNEVNILTLSNGRYVEYFTYDTLRQVGSAMFNTNTHKVEYFITEDDTVRQHILARAKEASRFMSVDPISSSFPMLSPYQYASNTPIQAIDLDGLEALEVIKTFMCGTTKSKINVVVNEDLYFGIYVTNSTLHCYPGGHSTTEKQAIKNSRIGVVSFPSTTIDALSSVSNSSGFSSSQLSDFAKQSFDNKVNDMKNTNDVLVGATETMTKEYDYTQIVEGEEFKINAERQESSTKESYTIDKNVFIQAQNNSEYIQNITNSLTSSGYNVQFVAQNNNFSGNINTNDVNNPNGISITMQATVNWNVKISSGDTKVKSITHTASGQKVENPNQ